MNVNATSNINSFLNDRLNNQKTKYLHIKNNQLEYGSDVSCGTLFAAKFGFGNAAMPKIAKFIKKNYRGIYPDIKGYDASLKFNAFLKSYNAKQYIAWKTSCKILNVFSKKEQQIRNQLSLCQKAFQALTNQKSQNELDILQKHCNDLLDGLSHCDSLKKPSKKEKKLLNEILTFKNTVRASLFPPGEKALKGGPGYQFIDLPGLNKDLLKNTLKKIRTSVLRAYFRERLEVDAFKVAALKKRFHDNIGSNLLREKTFLENLLDKMEKKVQEGKPLVHLPTWFHCTKDVQNIGSILDTHILFAHRGSFGGAFVSNAPEYGITYGVHCFFLNDQINRSGTKDKKNKKIVYPKQSAFDGNIDYADEVKVSKKIGIQDNHQGIRTWIAFQRGADTLTSSGLGTEGIPMNCKELVNEGGLKYYGKRSVSFIVSQQQGTDLLNISKKRRLDPISYNQSEAFRQLIRATFDFTLPKNWQGKIRHA